MAYIKKCAIFCIAMVVFMSCQKEYSLEVGGAGGNTGGVTPKYGWSFTGTPAADYHGCIDTAFYTIVNGLNSLMLSGTDSAGNSFNINLISSGKIQPGTYTASQGAYLAVADNNGNTYLPKQPSNISLQLTIANDTLIEGTFSGTLTEQFSNQNFTITGGKLKALVGKENPCTMNTGTGIPAEYSLAATGNNCSNAVVEGEYVKATELNSSNFVEIGVNVTSPGDWSITTSTVNGIKFAGSGTFSSTGLKSVILMASGTPVNEGATSIPVTAGTSSCSFVVNVENSSVVVPGSGDYFPTTANSNWVYFVKDLSSGDEDSTLTTSTGNNITAGGQTYAEFDNDFFGYVYRKSSGIYYRYGPVDIVGIIDSTETSKEMIFLKDNVPASSTWESPTVNATFNGTPVKYKRVFTITAKDVSLTIRGKIYNNVITVKEEFMLEVAGTGFSAVEQSVISYARGVGLVQFRNDFFEIGVDLKRFQVF